MSHDRAVISRIVDAIKKNRSFFIAGHVKPDGDTVGSSLALASLLKRLGKKPAIYSSEPLPENLSFLKNAKNIIISSKATKEFDCAIILECMDFERMGNIISSEQAGTIINIDHHYNSGDFGNISYINPKASSSAEQIFRIYKYLGLPLKKDEAEALYVGLVTDTGQFQHSNTTPEALTMAAQLLDTGVMPHEMYDRLYAAKTLSSLNLLGFALNTLKIDASGKVAYMEIKHSTYAKAKSNVTETEGIINYAMMIPQVQVGILFRETETPGSIKVSLRSRAGFDVNKVSRHFGGGGHKYASGCTVKGDMKSTQKKVLDLIRNSQK